MAKQKPESGPGTFMILVLVFFVLATIILGVTTYLGYKGQEELETQAKKAADDAKAARAQADEQLTRRNYLRTVIGTATPDDRKDLAGAAQTQAANLLQEHNLVTNALGAAGALPGGPKAGFNQAIVDGVPAIDPNKSLPAITKEWYNIAQNFKNNYEAEKRAKETAQANAQAAQAQREKDKEAFDAGVKALNDTMTAKIKSMDAAFAALKTEADKAGINFKNIENQWAEEKTRLEERLAAELATVKVERDRRTRAENADPSDIEGRWKHLNPARMAEKMGTVSGKSGQLVTLEFSTPLHLTAGQTFVVIPSNRSLVEVLEREKALEKNHHERISLGPRDPFTDNELIKGMVEVTDPISRTSARARITWQANAVRDPITRGDQLFNMTLSSGAAEHIAFAGIVDLDGDGRPDTEQFIRLLENNNLVVDSYLDLKTGQRKGRGMNSGTRFLILGSDAPDVGQIKAMKREAATNGTQLIDARVFMSLIGAKPPKNPAPPLYTSVNLGEDNAAAPPAAKEGDNPPMPPAGAPDAKKD
jgi:hypothetical protein